jgi:hypothetical protein
LDPQEAGELMQRVLTALCLIASLASFAEAQSGVSFTASPDHAAAFGDGQQKVTSYELRVTGTATSTVNLGKPAPANNVITVTTLKPFFDALPFGSYSAVVAAVGPGGSSASAAAPFTRSVTLTPPAPPGSAPTIIDASGNAWVTQGIGGAQGEAVFVSDQLQIQTVGGNTWNTSDDFWFVHQQHSGDGAVLAKVDRVDYTHAKAKGGVEFREQLDGGSRVVQVNAIADGRVELLYRAAQGTNMVQQVRHTVGFPMWVRLVRSGNVFTAAHSKDGVTWTTLGTVTNAMSPVTYAGALHAAIQSTGAASFARLVRQ